LATRQGHTSQHTYQHKTLVRIPRSVPGRVRINLKKLYIPQLFPLLFKIKFRKRRAEHIGTVYGQHGNNKNIVLARIGKVSQVTSKDVFFN
jgi:hypothetical protein